MTLSKTEQTLMTRLNESGINQAGTFGKRENNSARKLEQRGLVRFVSTSHYVSPRHSNVRRRNGDYVGFFVVSGRVEGVA